MYLPPWGTPGPSKSLLWSLVFPDGQGLHHNEFVTIWHIPSPSPTPPTNTPHPAVHVYPKLLLIARSFGGPSLNILLTLYLSILEDLFLSFLFLLFCSVCL